MVIKGTCKWIFYTHINFRGPSIILGPKMYDTSAEFARKGSTLSSARALPPDSRSALVLFEGPHFTGRMLVLYRSEPTALYSHHNFNDRAQSAIITGTPSWTLFFHGQYQGARVTLRRGYYPTLPASVKGQVSSVIMNGDVMNTQDAEPAQEKDVMLITQDAEPVEENEVMAMQQDTELPEGNSFYE